VRSFYPALAQCAQRLAELRRVEDRRIDPPHTARDGLRAGNDAAFEEQAAYAGLIPRCVAAPFAVSQVSPRTSSLCSGFRQLSALGSQSSRERDDQSS
jgi:hypothetical protein